MGTAAPSRFGELLKRKRTAAGLTQEELAERAGLSARAVQDLERGRRRSPHPGSARRLAEALGLPAAERTSFGAGLSDATPTIDAPNQPVGRSTVPAAISSFVGREQELAELRRLLPTTRLLTLTGPGGVGKTRLALEIARGLVDEGTPAVFVDLAALGDPMLVDSAVAAALEVCQKPNHPLRETVARAIGGQPLLLVLDNCEHLVAACAELAEALLGECPQLRVLCTSRESLRADGEVVWRVSVLSLPRLEQRARPVDVGDSEAVRLFVERAGAALPTFALSDQNARAVAEICVRLDGIPLALELAAARVAILGVEQLAARVGKCLRLLTAGRRTAPTRQQTLRAAVDWSYALLSDPERLLFRRLTVFAGGWTLEAAEAVADADLDLLASLVDKSLVTATPAVDGAVRYRILETLREYGHERLGEHAEAEAIHRRHAEYFLELAERVAPELIRPDQALWLRRLEMEHDNFRAALGWLDQSGDVEGSWRLGAALWRFWEVRGYLSEGRERLAALVARGSKRTAARAAALNGAGVLANQLGDFPAARAWLEESLGIRRELDDQPGIAAVLNNLGNMASVQGDDAAARRLLGESIAIKRELGDRWAIANSLSNVGLVLLNQGDYAAARALHVESLAVSRDLGDRRYIAISLHNLGRVALAEGDYTGASTLLVESLAVSRELGDHSTLALVLDAFAELAAAGLQAERALRVAGGAEALREAIGCALAHPDRLRRTLTLARRLLPEPMHACLRAEGRAMSLEQAVEEALAAAQSTASASPPPQHGAVLETV
jgi:predicted ATPase/DNA-binding XRE family transcriptional regulator